MEDIPGIHLRYLQVRLHDIAYEITRLHPAASQPHAWHPAINVYRCRDTIVVAVDLAGLDRAQIGMQVEPRCVSVHGHRSLPEPPASVGPPLQVLAMEIDHGAFERQILLPADVVIDQVVAEQREGLLWIFLPLAECS